MSQCLEYIAQNVRRYWKDSNMPSDPRYPSLWDDLDNSDRSLLDEAEYLGEQLGIEVFTPEYESVDSDLDAYFGSLSEIDFG